MTVIEAAYADTVDSPRQDKPWGHEILFAGGENGYVGKLLMVLAGQTLSLQYHDRKDETLRLLTGDAVLEHGPSAETLISQPLQPGDCVHIPPRCVHRISARTDAVFVEVSTAGPGWREDVVRLDDRYGRAGTSRP